MPLDSKFSPTLLRERHCQPCKGKVAPLASLETEDLSKQVPDWSIEDAHHLVRRFRFPDFQSALYFVNRVGAVAEEEGHHPDILLGWGKVEITLWTHQADGLTENDFILAARIDSLFAPSTAAPLNPQS